MNPTLRRAIPLVAALFATAMSGQASAALVTMTGQALSFVGVGPAAGTPVSATFDLDFDGEANVFVRRDAVRSFSVQFFDINFTSNDLTNWDFVMFTNASGQVGGLQFLASFGGATPDDLGVSVDLRADQWWTSYNGICDNNAGLRGPCAIDQTGAFSSYGNFQWGSAAFTVTPQAEAVSEPASLALVGVGLLGAIALSRRSGKSGRKF
ncbi:PEP-CTERM sorting domain-containing protein [Paucibacter sp. PLA-PC-4]|uniref:PEP-CTERM sorting domain-containing protein n=1 Tax=Paucibacter sp. PLA-PC-4 TaxID=2993655 RepID=UPI0022495309|nr:PEP-CTERM sorting domain-containing protein [Paucibacter sp. PLA-PC-4]MCX2863158.1 PEP-CTERM sorting domain-containing protein [Paucibacter sp. PLA-PC-4]